MKSLSSDFLCDVRDLLVISLLSPCWTAETDVFETLWGHRLSLAVAFRVFKVKDQVVYLSAGETTSVHKRKTEPESR